MEYNLEIPNQQSVEKHIKVWSKMYSRRIDKNEGFKNPKQLETFTQSKLFNPNEEKDIKSVVFATPSGTSEPVGVLAARDIQNYNQLMYFKNLKFMKMTTAEMKYLHHFKKRVFNNGEKVCLFHFGCVIKQFQNMGVMENMLRVLGEEMLKQGYQYGICIEFLPISGKSLEDIVNHFGTNYGEDALKFHTFESLRMKDKILQAVPVIISVVDLKKALECKLVPQTMKIERPKL